MAVVLVVAAVLVFAMLVCIALLNGISAVFVVALLGPLLALAVSATIIWAARRKVSAWASRFLTNIAGPAVVISMPPRVVFDAMLMRVLGDRVGHGEITTALLGGGGREVGGRDVAVSRATSVRVRMERIDELTNLNELTWSHEFSGVGNNHRLVMFATSSSDIFTLLTSNRVYPLFEAWFVQTEDQLENFVPGFKDHLEVGVDYRDVEGALHTVEPRAKQGQEVELRDYDAYVKLPDRVDRQDLRIFELDLHDLADPDHVVEAVERMTLRASALGAFDQGFITWSAPFPCFVDTIIFDVHALALGGEKLVYKVLTNTVRISKPIQDEWTHVHDSIDVTVRSWMLPGHGVTLLWRVVNGVESQHGSEHY